MVLLTIYWVTMKYIKVCGSVSLNDIGNGIQFLLFNVIGDGDFYRTHNTVHT